MTLPDLIWSSIEWIGCGVVGALLVARRSNAMLKKRDAALALLTEGRPKCGVEGCGSAPVGACTAGSCIEHCADHCTYPSCPMADGCATDECGGTRSKNCSSGCCPRCCLNYCHDVMRSKGPH